MDEPPVVRAWRYHMSQARLILEKAGEVGLSVAAVGEARAVLAQAHLAMARELREASQAPVTRHWAEENYPEAK